jgi:hypothetical protein
MMSTAGAGDPASKDGADKEKTKSVRMAAGPEDDEGGRRRGGEGGRVSLCGCVHGANNV